MHEMSLVRDIIANVEAFCESRGIAKVSAVYLSVGYARDVVDDLMDGLFKHLARGTVVEGADLIMRRIPITVRCRRCGTVFPINVYDEETWVCPACHTPRDYELVTGMEFSIDRIAVPSEQACAAEPCGVPASVKAAELATVA